MDITFNTVSRCLQRLTLPRFPQAHDRLVALVRAGGIVEAFKNCFPEKWTDVGPLGLLDMNSGRLLEMQLAAISAVGELFPVQEDYMDMLVQDDEPLQIHPESCGFAWDDEWLNEVLLDPSNLQTDSALALFFKVLWLASTQFGCESGLEAWERAREHFGYPCNLPRLWAGRQKLEFDWPAFCALLEVQGLGRFIRAANVALCDTGNLFLDTSPEEYGYNLVEVPDFTTNNILELKRIWAEAEGWLADYKACNELAQADPAIYTRLAAIWGQACKPKTAPAKTLMEVFSQEEKVSFSAD
jgi:hypothetical protein